MIIFVFYIGNEHVPTVQVTANVESNDSLIKTSDQAVKNENTFTIKDPPKGKKIILEIPAPSLANNMIEEPVRQNISIYLPKFYDNGDKKYPVVYYLPGWRGSYDGTGDMFKYQMDILINKGISKEMIIVCINGTNKLFGSYYVNSIVTGNWEDFIVKDVVSYIDANYRTIEDARARGISGNSMGGFGCLSIAMHYPDVFSSVCSMSPELFDQNGVSAATNIRPSFLEIKEYENMTREEAHRAYMQDIPKFLYLRSSYAYDFYMSLGYASAFVPDPYSNAPYIKSLSGDTAMDQKIMEEWDNGLGGWDEKVNIYKNNLKKLKAITMEYGTNDEYSWASKGCIYLSGLLQKNNINHKLVIFKGKHEDLELQRIRDFLIPFFSDQLMFE